MLADFLKTHLIYHIPTPKSMSNCFCIRGKEYLVVTSITKSWERYILGIIRNSSYTHKAKHIYPAAKLIYRWFVLLG